MTGKFRRIIKSNCKVKCIFQNIGRESERLLQYIIKKGASQDEMLKVIYLITQNNLKSTIFNASFFILKVAELIGCTEKNDAMNFYIQHLINVTTYIETLNLKNHTIFIFLD